MGYMLLSDKGTAYSENHFSLTEDMRIVNNFTGKIVGVLVRKIEVTNYLFPERKPSFLKLFVSWMKKYKYEWETVNTRIEEEQILLNEMAKLDKDQK